MTKFMDKSFSTYAPGDGSYRDNWERIFGKKDNAAVPGPPKEPETTAPMHDEAYNPEWKDEAVKTPIIVNMAGVAKMRKPKESE